ncbi:MAG: nitrilase-related carbon-nitrogen hydrolase [Marinilabiliaceae bacterium]
MDKLKISSAQFEHRSCDKIYNLSIIEKLSRKASSEGSDIIAFHECAITGYTFARELSREQMLEISEFVPNGESITALTDIAREYNIVVLAGLFEKDTHERLLCNRHHYPGKTHTGRWT